jgi:large subunit ribosomal protein L19
MKLKNLGNPNVIQIVENEYLNNNVPFIQIGDTIRLAVSIREGNKERLQFNEGVVIAKNNSGVNKSVTIRKIMKGVGVERIYLINSPKLKEIVVLRSSRVRRSKLYYLRSRVGKATRLQQKVD